MNAHFNAHRQLSRYTVSDRRERRYPVLTALDLFLHFTLCATVLVLTLCAIGILITLMMPDFGARLSFFFGRLLGL